MIDRPQGLWFEFVEAPPFARFRAKYLNDDEFTELQLYLAAHPEAGDLVPGAGGIRKLRWRDPRPARESAADCELFTIAFSRTRKFGCCPCTTKTKQRTSQKTKGTP
jgi:hypothetical protein